MQASGTSQVQFARVDPAPKKFLLFYCLWKVYSLNLTFVTTYISYNQTDSPSLTMERNKRIAYLHNY